MQERRENASRQFSYFFAKRSASRRKQKITKMVNHREQERRGRIDRHRSETSLDEASYKFPIIV